MTLKASLIGLLSLSCLLASTSLAAADIGPAPKTPVSDRAGIIDSATERELILLLLELEEKTGARIIVLTVESTDGQDIHQFAFDRADKWKFGRNKKSASVLVVIAAKDRKYWFEVGYDWEGVLPDGYVGQVGRQYLVPHFQAGRLSKGIFEATAALAGKIAEDRSITLTGMPKLRPMARQRGPLSLLLGLLPILFLFMFLGGRSRGRHRNMLFWGLLAGMMMGGRGGGGFGGGGFGGFGGGGGGGFGGGGAGGSW